MARVHLEPIAEVDAGAHRVWQIAVAVRIAGALEGTRVGDEVRLRLTLDHEGPGTDTAVAARGALGQLLGLAPWGPDVRYVIGGADAAVAHAAAATGFVRDESSPDAEALWRRAAPRPRPSRDDITRFLDSTGRIDRYPIGTADRHELLLWVAQRAFAATDVLTEPQVNNRLEPYAPGGDVAVLRRYLVDHELLERTRSGSQYAPVRGS